jgi:hypothetical protein
MTRLFHACILLVATILIASVGCRTTTSPEPSPDAGIYLPSGAGSTWVYAMAAGNATYRTMLGDTVLGGIVYHMLQDSTTYRSNGVDTAYVGRSFFRSDEHSLYEVLSIPVREGVFLDTRDNQTWTEFEDTTGNPLPRRWDYTMVGTLPTFTIGGTTYTDVLQIENLESYPSQPNYKPTLYEFYYAKNIGLIEVLDSTYHIVGQWLTQYHIQ